jgi:hypothetical protein
VLCPELDALFRESATRLANAFTARIGASEERTFSMESFPFLFVVDEVFFGTEPNGNGNARAHHFAPPPRRPHRRAVRDGVQRSERAAGGDGQAQGGALLAVARARLRKRGKPPGAFYYPSHRSPYDRVRVVNFILKDFLSRRMRLSAKAGSLAAFDADTPRATPFNSASDAPLDSAPTFVRSRGPSTLIRSSTATSTTPTTRTTRCGGTASSRARWAITSTSPSLARRARRIARTRTSRPRPRAARRSRRRVRSVITLVPIRPRSRGERRSLRTLSPGVSLRPGSLAFNPRPRRLSTPPSDAFQLHPDIRRFVWTLDPQRRRSVARSICTRATARGR